MIATIPQQFSNQQSIWRIDEASLIESLRAGNESAFEFVVHEFGGRLLTTARRYFRCEEDAADAVQEAFISAFQSISRFSSGSRLYTWLHRIVINACLMKIRARARRREMQAASDDGGIDTDCLLPNTDSYGGPDHLAELAELRLQIRQQIDRLPESYRAVLTLRDIEERDTEETARLLGETCANIKTRLHRARQALRQLLDSDLFGYRFTNPA